MAQANIASRYRDGEAFFVALYDRFGEGARERAFRHPPADMAEVLEPAWYLDPETRPRTHYDLDAGLDRFAARIEELGWDSRRTSVNAVQLGVLAQLVPEEDRQRFLRATRQNRVLVAGDPGDPSKQLTLGVFVADSEADAHALLAALEAISRERDRLLREDASPDPSVTLVNALYKTSAEGPWQEVSVAKVLRVGSEDVPLRMWFGQRGRIVAEAMDVGESIKATELRNLGLSACERAMQPKASGDPATGVQSEPADEEEQTKND
jgi:hypothetical protein